MADNQKTTPTRSGGRTARNSANIRSAVLTVLQAKGYDGLSFQNVAEAAGVNRTTLYRRWKSRAELVLWALRQSSGNELVMPDTGSLMGDLRALLNRITVFVSSPIGATLVAATFDMVQRGEAPPSSAAQWKEGTQGVMLIFERAKARSELPSNYDSEAGVGMLVGSLYFRLAEMGQMPDKAWIDRVLTTYAKAMNLKTGKK